MSMGAHEPGAEKDPPARDRRGLLPELRVIQTGTQILTGFLLTLAFQPRFVSLDSYQVTIYLTLVLVAGSTTALGLAPVSLHRALFRRGSKERIVLIGNRLLILILVGVLLTLSGTVLLIFDVVVGRTAGLVAGGLAFLAIGLVWILLPIGVGRSSRTPRG